MGNKQQLKDADESKKRHQTTFFSFKQASTEWEVGEEEEGKKESLEALGGAGVIPR